MTYNITFTVDADLAQALSMLHIDMEDRFAAGMSSHLHQVLAEETTDYNIEEVLDGCTVTCHLAAFGGGYHMVDGIISRAIDSTTRQSSRMGFGDGIGTGIRLREMYTPLVQWYADNPDAGRFKRKLDEMTQYYPNMRAKKGIDKPVEDVRRGFGVGLSPLRFNTSSTETWSVESEPNEVPEVSEEPEINVGEPMAWSNTEHRWVRRSVPAQPSQVRIVPYPTVTTREY